MAVDVTQSSDEVAIRALGRMPFLERRELASVSSLAERTALNALHRLEMSGLTDTIRHSLNERSRLQRWYLTPRGIGKFAELEELELDEALRLFPLSAEWRRSLLRRIETLATCYRIALDASLPYCGRLSWRWERSGPLDAFMTLPDGRAFGMARFGPTLPRRSTYSRLGSLLELHRRNTLFAALLLVPGPIEAHGILDRMKGEVFDLSIAVEGDVRSMKPGDAIWRSPIYRPDAAFPIEGVIRSTVRRPAAPPDAPPRRISMPRGRARGGKVDPDLISCNLVRPATRMLDALADWPLMHLSDLSKLLGIGAERARAARAQLSRSGLIVGLSFGKTATERRENETRLALSLHGLRYLARRDRTRLSDLKAYWEVSPDKSGDHAVGLTNHRIAGSKLRVLARELKHTSGVHRFISALAAECRIEGEWELAEILPPHRWERWFHYNNRRYGLKPDATGQLVWRGRTFSLLLEYEARAIKPAHMDEKLLRYRRYFGALETQRDFQGGSMVAIVFPDTAAASRFSAFASRQTGKNRRSGADTPLLVGNMTGLVAEGVLGRCWLIPSALSAGLVNLQTAMNLR